MLERLHKDPGLRRCAGGGIANGQLVAAFAQDGARLSRLVAHFKRGAVPDPIASAARNERQDAAAGWQIGIEHAGAAGQGCDDAESLRTDGWIDHRAIR